MFATISTERLSVGSIYKLWLIGLSASLIPLCIVMGVLALFGFNTVTWNGQQVHGIAGLLDGVLVGIILSLLFTAVLGSAAALGLWLYSRFRPISLRAKNLT